MTGLVGILSENAVDEQLILLDKMLDSLKHEEFYRVDKYICSCLKIARVHLGIFNPELQPIFNEDKSLCIFMDGKIYNYDEEISKLKAKGHKFNIVNDPEFCLHLYEEYGKDFVKKLNGSFLIAICDLKGKKLLLVNDRYGLRPHYYAINNGKLLFAPEVKAILQDKDFKKELNDETVADFFAFGEILGNKTFFEGIEVLPPASILTYDKGGEISIRQYWDFNYEPDYSKTEDEFVDELVKNFKKAVAIRMKDKYRYGVSLSGGLDSRSVVAAIEKNKRKDVLAYTFGPLDCNEVKIAKKVADITGMMHKNIEITPEMIIDNSENEILYSDGMDYIGVSYIPPAHRVVKDNNIDVVFDGFLFDVTLGGSFLTEEIVNAKSKDELLRILYKKQRFFSEIEFSKLFVDEYYNKIRHYPLLSFEKEFNVVKETHPGNCCDYFILQNHARRWTIGGHILMRTCIENSVPTYDNNLIDIILKIPPELRLNHRIYRKFLKKLSPELATIIYDKTMIRVDAPLILWKVGAMYLRIGNKIKRLMWKVSKGKVFIPSKRGYVEFNDWLRTNENWKRFFKELLLDKSAMSKTYFSHEYIKTLIKEHKEGIKNNSQKIFYLASFELFLRLFMDDKL